MAQPHACAWCGLPVTDVRAPAEGPVYCCYGCRFADAVSLSSRGARGLDQDHVLSTVTRLGLAIFFAINVMMFAMALWAQDAYPAHEGEGAFAHVLYGLFRYLCMLFAIPVLLLAGGPLLENALATLRQGRFSMDLLLLLGVGASYAYSVVSVLRDDGPVYFEVGCMVLVFVTLGRWLEATGKLKAARAALSLQPMLPATVRRIEGREETSIPLEAVKVGDTIRILAGERVPCDGRILGHAAHLDEQILTGESEPVARQPGDAALGGSLNLDTDLMLAVTATPENGAIGRIIASIREAQQAKGHYQRLADRVTAWFLPTVIVIALATFAYHAATSSLGDGILASLAVLVIACPCALGIATPLAVWAALGQAARHQVLFRSSEALERLALVRAVRFDKTGTLTTGDSRVVQFTPTEPAQANEVRSRAALLAASSNHVHAKAIGRFVGAIAVAERGEVRTLPGKGLRASWHAEVEPTYLGSTGLMREAGLAFRDDGPTGFDPSLPISCIGWSGNVRGFFVFHEDLRSEAAETLDMLRKQGIDVAVLTGDHEARAATLARLLRVPIEARMLPEDKVEHLRQVRRRLGPVAMVGDGINDGPALAEADVGIAMGQGTDLARISSEVCLLGNDLTRIPWAIDLARRGVRVIRQNLFWAFAYNVIGIGLAAAGMLNPIVAALAMALSSLFVVANSMRLAAEGG